jgi:hypothetical protein
MQRIWTGYSSLCVKPPDEEDPWNDEITASLW